MPVQHASYDTPLQKESTNTIPPTIGDNASAGRWSQGEPRRGFRSKNPTGTREKPASCTGITGQSSGRGLCVTPSVYQSTTSPPTSERFAAIHLTSPSPPSDWLG